MKQNYRNLIGGLAASALITSCTINVAGDVKVAENAEIDTRIGENARIDAIAQGGQSFPAPTTEVPVDPSSKSSPLLASTNFPLEGAVSLALGTTQFLSALAESSETNAGVIAAGGAVVIAAGGANMRILSEESGNAVTNSRIDFGAKTGEFRTTIGPREWVNARFNFDYTYDSTSGKIVYMVNEFRGEMGGYEFHFAGTCDFTPKQFPNFSPTSSRSALTGTLKKSGASLIVEELRVESTVPFGNPAFKIGRINLLSGRNRFTVDINIVDGLPKLDAKYIDTAKPEGFPVKAEIDAKAFLNGL